MTWDDKVRRLQTLVAVTGSRNENACRDVLAEDDFSLCLLPFASSPEFVTKEAQTAAGRTDLIVVSRILGPYGAPTIQVHVWEMKAPQVSPFTTTTSGRASPTPELFEAENQLLHYVSEIRDSRNHRDRLHDVAPEMVKVGGIICGRRDNFMDGADDATLGLGRVALRVRQTYFYAGTELKLINWDDVLGYANGARNQSLTVATAVDAGAGPAVSGSSEPI